MHVAKVDNEIENNVITRNDGYFSAISSSLLITRLLELSEKDRTALMAQRTTYSVNNAGITEEDLRICEHGVQQTGRRDFVSGQRRCSNRI